MQPHHGFRQSNETDQTNKNITIGSKILDWVRSFHFWTEQVHRFVSGPNRCIWHGFWHCNESNENEPKHHYCSKKSGLGAFLSFLARTGASFHFRPEPVHLMQPRHGFWHSNESNENKQNITIGQKSGLDAFLSFLV